MATSTSVSPLKAGRPDRGDLMDDSSLVSILVPSRPCYMGGRPMGCGSAPIHILDAK